MKKARTSWRQIRSVLAAHGGAPTPRAAAEFWADFQARVSLYPQPEAAVRPARARMPWFWALGGAGATLLLAAAVTLVLPFERPGANTGVLSYEVPASQGAVMIWRDEATEATILWVTETGTEAKEPI
ncbi:MAG: hypothetical protein PHR35_05765 [Kiritimatiellae bacterium]|nr:hypothetical protein [Kiritimatiellia bacterium]